MKKITQFFLEGEGPTLRNLQTLRANHAGILRIKRAKFSGHCFYMNRKGTFSNLHQCTFTCLKGKIRVSSPKFHFCVCLKSITLRSCLSSSSFFQHFFGIHSGECGTQNILQTFRQPIRFSFLFLFLLFFVVYSFSKQVAAEGNSKRNILINVATCLSAYVKQTLSNGQKPV